MTSTKCSRPSSPAAKLMNTASNPKHNLFCASSPLPSSAKWHFHPTSKIASAKYRIKLLQSRLDSIVSFLYELKSLQFSLKQQSCMEKKTTLQSSLIHPATQRKAQIHQQILRLHRLKSKLSIQLQKHSKSSDKL